MSQEAQPLRKSVCFKRHVCRERKLTILLRAEMDDISALVLSLFTAVYTYERQCNFVPRRY